MLAVLVYGWVVRRTERRPATEVAGRGLAEAALGVGTLIGLAVFGLVILQLATNGYYEINGRGSTTGAVGLVGFMAAAVAKATKTSALWRPQAVGERQFSRSATGVPTSRRPSVPFHAHDVCAGQGMSRRPGVP